MPRKIYTSLELAQLFKDHINRITHPNKLLSTYEELFDGWFASTLRERLLVIRKEKRLQAQLKDWDALENLSNEELALERRMLDHIVQLQLKLFDSAQHIIIKKEATKKCGNDSLFATININPKVSGEIMKEIMDKMRQYAFKDKLQENMYCIEYASSTETHGRNTHAHWAFKTSYSKLRPGGIGIRNNISPDDRSAKGYIQRFFAKYYPDLNYDIRVEGSNYNNRLLYINKDDEVKYGKYPLDCENKKYIS